VPVTILAWHRLPEPFEQVLTYRVIRWLIQLRTGDGAEGWCQYVAMNVRLVGPGAASR
jgi:hypothetical protein